MMYICYTYNNKHRKMDSIEYVQFTITSLNNLQRKFIDAFPDDETPPVIMPASGKDGKTPKYPHARIKYGVSDAYAHIPECAANGALVLLNDSIIVIDCDDTTTADALLSSIPEFNHTVTTKTTKGYHFWFRSTQASRQAGMVDGARQLLHSNGERMPIDIKTMCKTGTRGVISIPPSNGKEWIRSPLDSEILPLPDQFVQFYLHFKSDSKTSNTPTDDDFSQSLSQRIRTAVDFKEVEALVHALPRDFKDTYDNWLKVMFCLKHVENSERCFNLLVNFSKDSKHWNENESVTYIKKKWDSVCGLQNDKGITIASLHYWVKTANPNKYHEILGHRIVNEIQYIKANHNDIARLVSKLLKNSFVCASVQSGIWYKYESPVWKQDVKQVMFRHEMSTTVVKAIDGAFKTFVNKQKQSSFTIGLQTPMFHPDDDPDVYSSSYTSSSECCTEAGMSTSSSRSTQKRLGLKKNSVVESVTDIDCLYNTVESIKDKLKHKRFKDEVVVECTEYMYDPEFTSKLDKQPHLIGFTNGVFDLSTKEFRESVPSDYISKTVGYPFSHDIKQEQLEMVEKYFAELHPNTEERKYVLTMLASQLYGDSGHNLVHLHAGFMGSASNGKSTCFNILEIIYGDYIVKFNVSLLTTKARDDAGRPQPHFAEFEGVRLIYGTEPNQDDVLHSGILKELSGGELISYRTLFSNEIRRLEPQFKIHIMCNKTPVLDGSDDGIKRRIRKIDYKSKFVTHAEADPARHMYPIDATLLSRVRADNTLKMAFMTVLLQHYVHGWDYSMPESIRKDSECYLNENNPVAEFVNDCIVKDDTAFFTLAQAKTKLFTYNHAFFSKNLSSFKKELEKCLMVSCIQQKKIKGVKYKNAFLGWRVIDDDHTPSSAEKEEDCDEF